MLKKWNFWTRLWWNIAFSSLDVHISKSTWHFNFFPEQGGEWRFFMSSWGGNKMTSYLRIFRKSNFCKSLPWERNRCVPFCNFNYNQNMKWFTFLNPCRQSFILLEGKCKSWCGHILFVSTAKEDTFLTPDIFTFFFILEGNISHIEEGPLLMKWHASNEAHSEKAIHAIHLQCHFLGTPSNRKVNNILLCEFFKMYKS